MRKQTKEKSETFSSAYVLIESLFKSLYGDNVNKYYIPMYERSEDGEYQEQAFASVSYGMGKFIQFSRECVTISIGCLRGKYSYLPTRGLEEQIMLDGRYLIDGDGIEKLKAYSILIIDQAREAYYTGVYLEGVEIIE